MVFIANRAEFDAYLDDPDLTLLLCFDGQGRGRPIHDLAERKLKEPWRVVLLMDDVSLLRKQERENWGADNDGYIVLGVNLKGQRVFVESGGLDALSLARGGPSILRIRQAFARGDQA